MIKWSSVIDIHRVTNGWVVRWQNPSRGGTTFFTEERLLQLMAGEETTSE